MAIQEQKKLGNLASICPLSFVYSSRQKCIILCGQDCIVFVMIISRPQEKRTFHLYIPCSSVHILSRSFLYWHYKLGTQIMNINTSPLTV